MNPGPGQEKPGAREEAGPTTHESRAGFPSRESLVYPHLFLSQPVLGTHNPGLLQTFDTPAWQEGGGGRAARRLHNSGRFEPVCEETSWQCHSHLLAREREQGSGFIHSFMHSFNWHLLGVFNAWSIIMGHPRIWSVLRSSQPRSCSKKAKAKISGTSLMG